MPRIRELLVGCLAVNGLIGLAAVPAHAAGKLQLYVVRMEPYGQAADAATRPSWGGGVSVVVPAPLTNRVVSGVAGIDYVHLMDRATTTYDPQTELRLLQVTSQGYARLYIGGEVGPHGRGFFRPHVGMNVSKVIYEIGTDLVIPDDGNSENTIRQSLDGQTKSAFGYDVTVGCDFNLFNKVSLDAGARYLKTFGTPEQLGPTAVRIDPEYVAYYLGLGVNFDVFKKRASPFTGE